MTDETTALAALLHADAAIPHRRHGARGEVIHDQCRGIAARLIAAGVRVAPSPSEDGRVKCAYGHWAWPGRCEQGHPLAVAPSPETPGLREANSQSLRVAAQRVLDDWNRIGAQEDGYRALRAALATEPKP